MMHVVESHQATNHASVELKTNVFHYHPPMTSALMMKPVKFSETLGF
jgi:hypothetical protein